MKPSGAMPPGEIGGEKKGHGMHVSPEKLREMLEYNPDSGLFTWKERRREEFKSNRGFSTWNAQHAGKPAFANRHGRGYLCGQIQKRMVLAHRVAWAIHYGYWPIEIDHINHDKTDNRICNLREVTRAENMRNVPLRSNNKTGAPGVKLVNGGRWAARLGTGGSIYLGTFSTFDAAVLARKSAEISHGYHKNHGIAKR